MPDILRKAGSLADRLANRLIWKLASTPRKVETATPIVTFTFDDVPDTALSNGATILEKYDARGTFYIAGGLCGTVETDRTLIAPAGCRELARRGHEIGCHTFSHRAVRTLAGAALGRDLDRNAAFLAEHAGVKAMNFAFPYNAAWPLARAELRRRYRTARAGGEAINRGAVDPLMLKAVEICQPEARALSALRWIDDVAARPGWLVFVTHDIADKPTPYGCTPAIFEQAVAHAAARGCEILTLAQALDRLGWREED